MHNDIATEYQQLVMLLIIPIASYKQLMIMNYILVGS